jgi:hypothetical protein
MPNCIPITFRRPNLNLLAPINQTLRIEKEEIKMLRVLVLSACILVGVTTTGWGIREIYAVSCPFVSCSSCFSFCVTSETCVYEGGTGNDCNFSVCHNNSINCCFVATGACDNPRGRMKFESCCSTCPDNTFNCAGLIDCPYTGP